MTEGFCAREGLSATSSQYLGDQENVYFFWKGRVALFAILKAMGVGEGDKVIMPGYTCIVVPNSVVYLGAKPIYVDIDTSTYNLDPLALEQMLDLESRSGRPPKALVVQHTYGIPADMDRICAIAKKYGLFVVEDCCHAIGSRYKEKDVGTFGDAAFFSSQWSKPITTGFGGWAVVNNCALIERMNQVYQEMLEPRTRETLVLALQYLLYSITFTPRLFWLLMGAYRKLSASGIMVGSADSCELQSQKPPEFEKRMSKWQRMVLERKMKKIGKVIEHRKWVVSLYERYLPEIGIGTVKKQDYLDPVFLRYPILTKDKTVFLERARAKRVEIGDWFVSPVHPNLSGWERVGYRKGMCLKSEAICNHVVNLPTHPKVTHEEIQRMFRFLSDIGKSGYLVKPD
jgi:perosamine synthetase